MSAIDCTKHKVIGDLHFGYTRLPIYYVVDAQHFSDEFTTGNIYIGGGSGEHPALTVANFDYYAAIYMENHIPSWLEDGDPTKYAEIEKELDKILDVHEYRSGNDGNYYFNFNEWPIRTWAKMHEYIKNCKDEENNRYDANRALAYTIGYFLLTNCQNLLSDQTVETYCKYVKDFINPYPLHISRATDVGNYANISIMNYTTI
jgi:hypothetical protein